MNSREAWKKFLLTLPDVAFFGLARHYLGELQTPFTKHRIIVDLESRLGRPDWVAARRELMTDEDFDALAALKVLGAPTPEEAAAFLGWEPERFRSKALNLQERFLAFPAPEAKHGELVPSPLVLEDSELVSALDPGRLYPWVPAPEPAARPPRLHEGTLLALLAFLLETPLEKTATGAWRKKTRNGFLERFAALGESEGVPRADLLLNAALSLGLVAWHEGETLVVWSYLDDFAALDRRSRCALLWLAPAYPTQGELFEAARQFPALQALLGGNRAFALTTLVRLSAAVKALGPARRREELFHSWIRWGLLLPGPVEDTWVPAPCLTRGESSDRPWLQANYELRLPSDHDLGSGWLGALACRLVRWDTPILFELDKAAVRRLLSKGVEAEALSDSLESLAGAPLSSNLVFSLRDWEADHRSMRLWKGTVLAVDEDRRHLVEHTEHFAHAVVHRFAPGVWLVREDLLAAWSKELEQKGLPPLPAVTAVDGGEWGRPWSFTGWTLDPVPEGPGPAWPDPSAPPTSGDRSGRLDALLAHLATLSLPADEREEWRARILRRVVLTTEQLTHPLGRGERSEAKGLDFGGKLRLAELAVASGSDLLEVGFRNEDGRADSRLVRPIRLDKQGGEVLLVAEDLETRKPFQVVVSRLSQVRKIKGSLLT
jgi:hypothetical protein